MVHEDALADELLVLAEGHCLANPGAGGLRNQDRLARSCANRAARIDAGGNAGHSSEPGGGRLRSDLDSRARGRVAGAERNRAASPGWEDAENHPAGQPARFPPGPGASCARKGDPKSSRNQATIPRNSTINCPLRPRFGPKTECSGASFFAFSLSDFVEFAAQFELWKTRQKLNKTIANSGKSLK